MTAACSGPNCGGTPSPGKNTVAFPRRTVMLVIAVITAIVFGVVIYVISSALAPAFAAGVAGFCAVLVGGFFAVKFTR